jgi:hypothetical protein
MAERDERHRDRNRGKNIHSGGSPPLGIAPALGVLAAQAAKAVGSPKKVTAVSAERTRRQGTGSDYQDTKPGDAAAHTHSLVGGASRRGSRRGVRGVLPLAKQGRWSAYGPTLVQWTVSDAAAASRQKRTASSRCRFC